MKGKPNRDSQRISVKHHELGNLEIQSTQIPRKNKNENNTDVKNVCNVNG